PGEGKPGEGKPGEGKPGEGKPGEGKPGEGKPGEGKPGEGKPGEGSPGERKPGEGSPGEGQPGEGGKESSGKPGSASPSSGNQPGQKPLERAVGNQKSAESNLDKGKGKAAEKDEAAAVVDLKAAREELIKERKRIASLPPEAFEEMAKGQDRTADKTDDLGKEMAKAAAEGGSGSGGEGEGGEAGKQQPGQQNVQQAQQQMKGASGKLRRKEPKQATRNQEKAVEELQKALEEIERRLAQLRKEMQAEKLAALEAHFRQMLEIQKPVTLATATLEKGRSKQPWQRRERLEAKRLADKERELAGMAQKALDIIVEDGTSVVFPRVVEQLREDLKSVGKLIDAENTGGYTQSVQRDIENTLKELIDALEEAQKQQDPSDSPPSDAPPSDEDPPLLPNSAELKLLKSAQLRVNNRTKTFDDVRPEGPLEPVLREEVKRIVRQQETVADIAREMVERN
ncbi:MAG: hypothetical protein WD176_07995, partial [Pirellulales bacterium]